MHVCGDACVIARVLRFLKNLLFCHGSEALRRNSFQIYQTIWKNVVFGLADFFFAFVSTWSAADLFNSWLKQLFNVLYTTLPVVLYSIFDRQLPLEVTLQTPVLYPAFSSERPPPPAPWPLPSKTHRP